MKNCIELSFFNYVKKPLSSEINNEYSEGIKENESYQQRLKKMENLFERFNDLWNERNLRKLETQNKNEFWLPNISSEAMEYYEYLFEFIRN